jgi:thioesterase domain-containing protein
VEIRQCEAVSAFLKRVQRDLVAAQEHSIFTMVSLLEDLRPVAHSPGISPISAGFTNVKKFKPNELPQSGFAIDYDANPKGYESFELYLNAVEMEDDLELHCHYDIKLFEEITIREWLTMLGSIFQDVAADPSRDVLKLAGLDSADSSHAAEITYSLISSRTAASDSIGDASVSQPASLQQFSASPAGSTMAEPDLLRALLPLWQQVLGIRKIGPDDEFFALGGHSIAAAQLFALIQLKLGYAAPLATLYEASTPRLLARVLSRGTKAEDWKSLVAINRHGDRTPLFLMHAAEGNILLYRSLAAHLGADQPVFGLQSAGLDRRSPIDARFEHVARHYIDEIRQIQPHGPYMLGGYCLGGTLALEMAQQLIESGETVGLVALIEDFNIRSIRWPLSLRHRLINRYVLNPWLHLHNLVTAQGAGKLDFFMDKLHVEIRRLKLSARMSWDGLRHRILPGDALAMHQAKIADIYEEALAQYEVRPYPGELTLFMAELHLAGMGDRLGGWGDVAQGGVRLYSLPFGARGSLVEPYVRQLAASLRACLDQAIERSQSASCDHEAGFKAKSISA